MAFATLVDEPNLEFSCMSSPPATIQIRLTRECAPPWLKEKNQRSEGIVMSFPVGKINLPAIVGGLRDERSDIRNRTRSPFM
jgi:hypothetical protein